MTCAHCTLKLPSHFLNGLIHVSRSSIFCGEKNVFHLFFQWSMWLRAGLRLFQWSMWLRAGLGLVRLARIPSRNHSSSSKLYKLDKQSG
jgi:hypothetical protein